MTTSVGVHIVRQCSRVDVSSVLPDEVRAEVAVTIIADVGVDRPRVVVFGFPGGGYTRTYFDLDHPALAGPGESEYHAARGWVFVSCDPLGGGDSTPLDPSLLDIRTSANAAHLVVAAIREQLLRGTAIDELGPVAVTSTIGVGHSLGGMQLIYQQAHFRTFDAVAVLGFSAIHTTIPTSDSELIAPHSRPGEPTAAVEDAWAGPLSDDIAHLRYAYHWDDVPPELVAADMSAGFPVRTADPLPPWICATFPPFAAICMTPGVVSREASLIDVPVFIGAGQRDVLRDVRAEATAYSSSRDLVLHEVPRCAHMHNFSPRRRDLWDRLHDWGEAVSSVFTR